MILFENCSFDNKSGIWKDENNILNDDSNDNDLFKEFETLSTSGKSFDKIIPIDNSFKFKKTTLVNNFEWKDVFYAEDNNFINFIRFLKSKDKIIFFIYYCYTNT